MVKRNPVSEKTGMRMKAILLCLALALSGITLAQTAAAQGAGSGPQEDVVDEVNTSRRTMIIAGETFEVESNASLEDSEGRPIVLSEIRATLNDGEGDFVEYALVGGGTARTVNGLRSIQSIRVLGGDYE